MACLNAALVNGFTDAPKACPGGQHAVVWPGTSCTKCVPLCQHPEWTYPNTCMCNTCFPYTRIESGHRIKTAQCFSWRCDDCCGASPCVGGGDTVPAPRNPVAVALKQFVEGLAFLMRGQYATGRVLPAYTAADKAAVERLQSAILARVAASGGAPFITQAELGELVAILSLRPRSPSPLPGAPLGGCGPRF